jgi:hypothetical protein
MAEEPQYTYYGFALHVDGQGRMSAVTGEPIQKNFPQMDLGEVHDITLGCEDGQLVVTSLAVAACPAGTCWKKIGGVWGCRRC